MNERRSRGPAPNLATTFAVLLIASGVLSGISLRVEGVVIAAGVVFAPSGSWTNVSFLSAQAFNSVRVDPTGVLFDTVRLGMMKNPASPPKANAVVSTWSPLQTILNGTVLDFAADARAGSSLTFSLSGLIPAREYTLQVDGAPKMSQFSDRNGFVAFVWSNFTIHNLSVRLGGRTGLPPPPVHLSTDFAFAPPSPGVGQRVAFSAVAGGGIPPYNYSWDFGDGAFAFGANVSHTYAIAGNETVTLTVVDVSGGSANTTRSLVVQGVPPRPTLYAKFSSAPASPYPGTPVTFSSVVSGGSSPYNYTWLFGDGSSAYAAFVVHAYGRAGKFGVTLAVRDSVAAVARALSNVTVQSAPTSGPGKVIAAFDVTVNGPTAAFTDRSSSDTGLPIVIHFWAFGDETTSQDPNPVHVYPLSGLFATYTVVLAVCDSGSHCDSTSRIVSLVNWVLILSISLVVASVAGLAAYVARSRVRRRRRPRADH